MKEKEFRESVILMIEDRIAEEYRKYRNTDVDWIATAARKIYYSMQLVKPNLRNMKIKLLKYRIKLLFKHPIWLFKNW